LPLCRVLDMRSGVVFQPQAGKDASGFDAKDFETTKVNVFGPLARLHTGGLAAVTPRLLSNSEIKSREPCDGGSYSYQNVNTAILGAVLERAYAQPLEQILSEKLWAPANASDAEWRRYDEALPVTPYCCLYARPIDWLRVAQYLANNGTADAPFLPQNVWQQFMGENLANEDLSKGGYANQVYFNILDRPGEALSGRFAYFMGSRGQTTYLMPDKKLVVVRFGGQIQRLHSLLYGVARSLPQQP
ncbi:MAG: serine hydrolase, partial [Hyphomicrobium sp.]|nr:serine hydrolase [Hyphomicrobium sp.]